MAKEIRLMHYDYLVVGAGLYGAVFAHEAAARREPQSFTISLSYPAHREKLPAANSPNRSANDSVFYCFPSPFAV